MSATAATLPQQAAPPFVRIGRGFVHPWFDLLVIGGGLSLAFAFLWLRGTRSTLEALLTPSLALLVLLGNSAHFAASTVRLYTKPHAMQELRFLTMALPLVSVGVLTLAVVHPAPLGPSLQALYLSWSPYHYGAQAYGLALMYAYRSGCSLGDAEKRLVRAACLAPFVAVLVATRGVGLDWLAPRIAWAGLDNARLQVASLLAWLAALLPLALCMRLAWAGRPTLPLISLCAVASNAVWLITLNRADAFAFATVFHGLQYLAIATIFHVKDRLRQPGNRRGWAYHALSFYAASLGLGAVLFQVWPFAYMLLGFGWAESILLVVAVINIHHFIVDAYIWKLRQPTTYRIVADPV